MEKKIEVGATDKQLRLWAAREAVRQGELRLSAQAGNLQAAESRAISLLGWTNAGILAGVALFSSHAINHSMLVIGIVAIPAFLAVGFCLLALWPAAWREQGTDIPWLLSQVSYDDNELATLEAMAKGYHDALRDNGRRLMRISHFIRAAFLAFSATAVIGVILLLFFTSSLICPVVL